MDIMHGLLPIWNQQLEQTNLEKSFVDSPCLGQSGGTFLPKIFYSMHIKDLRKSPALSLHCYGCCIHIHYPGIRR